MKQFIVAIAIVSFLGLVFGQQRIPLIEEFSSSTCPPCKTFNDGVFTPFLNTASLQEKYTVVNYRANWPNEGDPYCTAEAKTRISYYSVNGVPDCYIDGKKASNAAFSSLSTFTSEFNTATAKTVKAAITASYQITGATVSAGKIKTTATVTSTTTISNAYLYFAVVEKKTTKNASTNGEKEFHYVMMKMIPNASGKLLTLTANTPVIVTDSASLASTKIEEMTDLEVVAWIQISGTKEILQSALATDGTPVINRCLLNGCSSGKPVTMIRNNSVLNAKNAQISVHDLLGREIAKARSTTGTYSLAALLLPRGCYIVKVGKDKQALSKLISITR